MTTQMGQKRRGNVGWLLGSLGCVLLLGGGFVAYSELVPEEAAAPEVSPPPAVTGFSLGRNLEETARFLDGPYKLGVDRRFRFARGFQDSGELKAPAPWLQTFPEGHTFDPELPYPEPLGFDAGLTALGGATTQTPTSDNANEPASLADPEEDPAQWIVPTHQALTNLRQQSVSSQPGEAQRVAQALISLLFSMPDRLGTADELGGLALAFLARAEAETKAPLSAERAVLARALGYAETARRWAQELPVGAFRAYLSADDDALARSTRSPEGKHLWARRQLELGRPDADAALRAIPRKEQLSWEGVGLSLRARRFEDVGRAAATCSLNLELLTSELAGLDVTELTNRLVSSASTRDQERVAAEVRATLIAKNAAKTGLSFDSFSHLGRLERLLQVIAEAGASQLGARILEEYVSSQVASCVSAYVTFRFDLLSVDPERRARDAKDIFESEHPVFSELKRWIELRAEVYAARTGVAPAIATADSLVELGGEAHYLLFDDLARDVAYDDLEATTLARYLARRLDTRPSHLVAASERLAPILFDKRYSEFFVRSALREARTLRPNLAEWWTEYQARSANEPSTQGRTLREAALRARLDLGRNDWPERQALTQFLRSSGRHEEIPAVVAPWLDLHRNDTGFGREWALSTLALVELERGDPSSAWRVIQPIKESLKFSTLDAATRIALARRDYWRATELSKRGLSRYPKSPHALALRLRVAWTTQGPDAARDIIRSASTSAGLSQLAPLSDAFVDVFEGRAPEEAKRAAEAFLQSGAERSWIETLAAGFARRDHFEHCVRVLEIPVGAWLHQLSNDVEAYKCRKTLDGEAAAISWLKSRVPAKAREPMVMFAYQFDVPELLTQMEYPGETQKSPGSDYLWAMRAASSIRDQRPVHHSVLEHFKAEQDAAGYAAIGRFLVGELDRASLIEAATNNRKVNEVAYYLGLEAETQNRIGEALVWYRASVETNERGSGEWRLSKDRLYLLNRSPLPLAKIRYPLTPPSPARVGTPARKVRKQKPAAGSAGAPAQ